MNIANAWVDRQNLLDPIYLLLRSWGYKEDVQLRYRQHPEAPPRLLAEHLRHPRSRRPLAHRDLPHPPLHGRHPHPQQTHPPATATMTAREYFEQLAAQHKLVRHTAEEPHFSCSSDDAATLMARPLPPTPPPPPPNPAPPCPPPLPAPCPHPPHHHENHIGFAHPGATPCAREGAAPTDICFLLHEYFFLESRARRGL